MAVEKRCPTCGETKVADAFYRCQTRSDGLASQCKVCRRSYRRSDGGRALTARWRRSAVGRKAARRHNHSESGRAARKRYAQTENGRKRKAAIDARQKRTERGRTASRAADARRRVRSPGKIAARKTVYRAIRAGKLVRQPCACGNPKAEAHHADYAKPLDVTWLCRPCHRAEHRRAA